MNEQQITELATAMKYMRRTRYGVSVNIPADPGESETVSVLINRSDFAWLRTQYALETDDLTDPLNFSIDISLQNETRFYKGPAPMASTFGSPRTGIWMENAPATIIKNQTTVYIKVTNRYASSGSVRPLQVWIVGNEKDKAL
jgi:hypothetical protein